MSERLQHPRYPMQIGRDGSVVGPSGKVLKPRPTNCGYTRVVAYQDGKAIPLLIHRLVADVFCEGASEARRHVNHKNGDKSDNRAENLEWVTPSENALHAIARGLIDPAKGGATRRARGSCAGERNGRAKLTTDLVREIRSTKFKYGEAPWRRYGISSALFSMVKRGIVWQGVI